MMPRTLPGLLLLAGWIAVPAANADPCNQEMQDQTAAPQTVALPADFNGNRFESNEVYLEEQVGQSEALMLKAVGAKDVIADAHPGSVFASPSGIIPGVPSQDYVSFTWYRDMALIKREVIKLWIRALKKGDAAKAESLFKKIDAMVDYVTLIQGQDNEAGAAWGRGVLDVKWWLNGKPYRLPWGRHQSDGPALMAVTQMMLADQLIAMGRMDYVKQKLYNPDTAAHAAIVVNLDAVEKYYMERTFDYWEEREGYHYATSYAHLDAMRKGAVFAEKMGDSKRAIKFRSAAKKLEVFLDRFYSQEKGYLLASIELHGQDHLSLLDIEGVLAILHSAGDIGPHSPLDDRVLQTVYRLVKTFDEIYQINKNKKSSTGERLGTAMGRNREDAYDGYMNEPGKREGSAWFLATLGMAEFHYRFEKSLLIAGKIRVTDRNLEFFKLLELGHEVKVGDAFSMGSKEFQNLIDANRREAAGYIARVKQHAGKNGELSEQFNRYSGMMQGVENLTWSHAAVLSLYELMLDQGPAEKLFDLLNQSQGRERMRIVKEMYLLLTGESQ